MTLFLGLVGAPQPETITVEMINTFFFVIGRFIMVFACLTLSVFSTINEYQETADAALLHMEGLVVFWFTMEFICR